MQPPVTSVFHAKSLDLQLVPELQQTNEFANPDHFAVLSIDGKPVSKPGHKMAMPAPRWSSFNFDISSTWNIAIFRKRRWHKDVLVAQYIGQGRDFLDRNAKYKLTDERGFPMDVCLSVNVHLISHSPGHTSARDGQTFNTIGTSGTVNNVGGHFVVNGDYNVFQERTGSAVYTSAWAKDIVDVQTEDKIEKWMDAPDTSPNFNAARKKHQPDTGSWFLGGSAFRRWKEHPDILLWLHGGPGCGKTVLCAATIQKVIDFCALKASTGYAYFFFDGRSAEAALLVHEKLVRSIIMQLARRCDGLPEALVEMYRTSDKGSRQPPIEMLEATLFRILDNFNGVYIVIDSLDECSERQDVVQWIQSIAARASGKLHMVVSSRPEREIMQGLRGLSQLEEICISGHQTESDIHSYLNTRLSQRDAAKWEKAQTEMIKQALMDGADGMFRWVALQADHLIKAASLQELKKQLKLLPRDLNETYCRTLSDSLDPGNLRRLLQWLAYSRRALTIEEIAEVAVVDFGDDDSGLPVYEADRRFADPYHVLSLCYGLVIEVDVSIPSQVWGTKILKRGVKLAHFSVKEYLISEQILSGAAAKFHITSSLSHSMIAQTSLAYLLHFDKPSSLSIENFASFPLAQYAAEHWVAHFHSAGSDHGNDAPLNQLSMHLFKPPPSYAMNNSLCLYDPEFLRRGVDFNNKADEFASSLYYASRAGVPTAVANLIDKGADVNDNRGNNGPPLTVASLMGHIEIVQLLLAHGADVDAVGGKYSGTALKEAAWRGHLEIARLLLAHGADANGAGGTVSLPALQLASFNGHLETVQLLLAHGADVNAAAGHMGEPALVEASKIGHLAIVQLLLAHGADVNASAGFAEPALLCASHKGHLAIVKLLLAHGANVNAKSMLRDTALSGASSNGHVAIVKLLLEHGAVEIEGSDSSVMSKSSAGGVSWIEGGTFELDELEEEEE